MGQKGLNAGDAKEIGPEQGIQDDEDRFQDF
jgi:hypothetical protein